MENSIPILDIDLPNPRGHAPKRRPLSVRRTSSIDMTWPNGRGNTMHFHGQGRDIFTPAEGGKPVVVNMDEMFADIGSDRTIKHIVANPEREDIRGLIGVRGGGYLRQALNEVLPAEQEKGSPLYLLIDDISGTSLIAGWAWSRWPDHAGFTEEEMQHRREHISQMEGICIGFRPGSSALNPEHSSEVHKASPVPELPHPEDPDGWHNLTIHSQVSMRRARRIDVWIDGDIEIDATFQDSASAPEGGRVAVHEYSLHVTADPQTLLIKTISARPHVLPYPECPSAIGNVARMVGTPLSELRTQVLEVLPRIHGCTHLNDAIRAIAEVPALINQLQARL